MKHFVHIFLLLSMCFCFQVQAQGLKTFKLKNGMSVFIWEDSGKSDVFGSKVHRRSVHSTGKRKLPFMNKS